MIRIYQTAFTIIELLIVVAIISLLSFTAITSYHKSVVHSQQVQGQSDLLQLALKMQQHYASNLNYFGLAGTQITPENTGSPWVYADYSPSQSTEFNKAFHLTISDVDEKGQSFIIKATPHETSGLRAMFYSSTGERALDANNNGSFEASEYCWVCD